MLSRRRHAEALSTLEHRLTLQRQAEVVEARRAAHLAVIALAGLWLQGRAAGYRANADGEPSKPRTGPLTDVERRAIAHELEVCARDIAGLDLP